MVKGDGDGQQACDPVFLARRHFIPDVSITDVRGMKTAVEVKFFDGRSARLKEAMGQALIYLSGHYEAARVLLISSDGNRYLSSQDLKKLSDSVPGVCFGVHELAQKT